MRRAADVGARRALCGADNAAGGSVARSASDQAEPVERVRSEAQEVRRFADSGEDGLAEELDGYAALVGAQVELDGLDEA